MFFESLYEICWLLHKFSLSLQAKYKDKDPKEAFS